MAPAKTWPPLQGSSPTVGPRKKQQMQKTSSTFREICNRRATHEAICVEARKAWQRTYDLKRKASFSHRERTRRILHEHARAEGLVNDCLGSWGQAAIDKRWPTTAGARRRRRHGANWTRVTNSTNILQTQTTLTKQESRSCETTWPNHARKR